MTDLERLEKITDAIQKVIIDPIDHNNGEQLSYKIAEYNNILGTSTEAVALAERVYNEAAGELVEKFLNSKILSTDKKMIFAGRLKMEQYYVTLTDRQNKALTHEIGGLRTILSYLKSEQANLPTR